VSLLNLNERLLDFEAGFDFVFCPCLLDTKLDTVESWEDGWIDITLFNGAIRNAHNAEMARLLRRKSRTLVAFGTCATEGGIPGLSNLKTAPEHLGDLYLEGPSAGNPPGIVPLEATEVDGGTLRLPAVSKRVATLSQVVPVDYSMPGCPPETARLWDVLQLLARPRGEWPERGSVLGSGPSTVCAECSRSRGDRSIARLYRTHETVPNAEECLLDQGLLCMGLATRQGCGALCPGVNMPCSGCYGATGDHGAAMIGALGSVLDLCASQAPGEAGTGELARSLWTAVPDPAGSLYKFSLAGSLLGGRR
jgi:F420-non-reducing hydrogenase small subunit